MSIYKKEGWEHDWVPSTLGHGEMMCRRCLMTNQEALILGKCQEPPRKPTGEQDNESK